MSTRRRVPVFAINQKSGNLPLGNRLHNIRHDLSVVQFSLQICFLITLNPRGDDRLLALSERFEIRMALTQNEVKPDTASQNRLSPERLEFNVKEYMVLDKIIHSG